MKTTPTSPEQEPLRRGDRGPQVAELQRELRLLGFHVDADGAFGARTEESVRDLQRLFGLTVDGVAGHRTRRVIRDQLRRGWNINLPNAEELALRAQGLEPGTQGGAPVWHDPGAVVQQVPRAPTWPDTVHTAVPDIAPAAPRRSPPTGAPGGAPGDEARRTLEEKKKR